MQQKYNRPPNSLTHNSLIPEAPILVYPSLAATIGLEEATMLSLLTQFARSREGAAGNGYYWFALHGLEMAELMPFWQPHDIQRIATNLREQGLLLLASAPFTQSGQFKFAFNEQQSPPAVVHRASAPPLELNREPVSQKNFIAPGWSPDPDTLSRLGQLCIPSSFSLEQVPEFVRYWRERGDPAHAWGSKFMQHVLRKWRDFEAKEYQRNKTRPMSREWRPSEDALNVLVHHAGINSQFVEDAVPEFVLYWREQGTSSDNWNKKFRDHIQHQWLRYRAALEHDPTPRPLPANWNPSNDVYEVLRLANIDIAFAQALLPEFVIYWRDNKQVHSSWNTRFLQYVKKRWANRAHTHTDTQTTRDLSLAEQLTDRSWAL